MGVTDKTDQGHQVRGQAQPGRRRHPQLADLESHRRRRPDDDHGGDQVHQRRSTSSTGARSRSSSTTAQCDTVPPDYVCLRNEMRELVQTREALRRSVAHDAGLPRLRRAVGAEGRQHGWLPLPRQLPCATRPYHWDEFMGGTTVAKNVGRVVLQAHATAARPRLIRREDGHRRAAPEPAEQRHPQQDARARRHLDRRPREQERRHRRLKTELAQVRRQGRARVLLRPGHRPSRGAAPARRGQDARGARSPRSIMCFCDPVAPVFLYRTCEEQAYFPEQVCRRYRSHGHRRGGPGLRRHAQPRRPPDGERLRARQPARRRSAQPARGGRSSRSTAAWTAAIPDRPTRRAERPRLLHDAGGR